MPVDATHAASPALDIIAPEKTVHETRNHRLRRRPRRGCRRARRILGRVALCRTGARDIKSLSADEIRDLLAGKGMGLAKVAELNGYPGPAHVLELRAELGLTPEQQAQTEALFATMEADAQALGRELVERERALDRLFAAREISPAVLSDALTHIGTLQGRLRNVHLRAHLDQTRILMPEQAARYNELRGYGNGSGGTHAGHGHHHH